VTWEWTSAKRAALKGYLRELGLMKGDLTIAPVGDGHSNLTYLVTDGKSQIILRRPPPPPLPPGGHDVLREARLLQALEGGAVPVPRVLAVAPAGLLLDVPFFVMEFVPGIIITDHTPVAFASVEDRRTIGSAFVDGLIALHAIDWRGRGLDDFGKPEGINRRMLHRMRSLVANPAGELPSAFAGIARWLEDNAPQESGACIVHNDYRLGNVMWTPGSPAKLLAVLDWELATIGDPLADLGYVLAAWPEPVADLTPVQEFAAAILEPGHLSRSELADFYATRTGRDISRIGWYITAAHWKLAALYEYSRRRGHDAYYADPALVTRFLAAAENAADQIWAG
jgi:aminoglycoside phosphotransferase (APT) family kinase protein